MSSHQGNHFAGHDVELLESFIRDCIQQLPVLSGQPNNPQLPRICSTYHLSCSQMIKHVLGVMEHLSPRLCRLLSQIWDLTSVNFLVLLKLSNASVQEKYELLRDWRNFEKFHEELASKQTSRLQELEVELEASRVETRELRAQFHTTSQTVTRAEHENTQLRRILSEMVEIQQKLENRLTGNEKRNTRRASAKNTHRHHSVPIPSTDPSEENPQEEAEEWDVFQVAQEELEAKGQLEKFESCTEDLERIFHLLFVKEKDQIEALHQLDQFMNSNLVTLLWRYESTRESKFLQTMMNMRTISTQTEFLLTEATEEAESPEDHLDTASNDEQDGSAHAADDGLTACHRVHVATSKSSFPLSIRNLFTTRPKILQVLEKQEVGNMIWCFLVHKIDADGVLTRKHHPRLHLHRFLKERFLVENGGVVQLAEFHLLEFFKSVIFHHNVKTATCLAQATTNASSTAQNTSIRDTQTTSCPLVVVPEDMEFLDARIMLFGKICEVIPLLGNATEELTSWLDLGTSTGTSTDRSFGNMLSSLLNCLVDALGDLLEIDDQFGSLAEFLHAVTKRQQSPPVESEVENLWVVMSHHLPFIQKKELEKALLKIIHQYNLAPKTTRQQQLLLLQLHIQDLQNQSSSSSASSASSVSSASAATQRKHRSIIKGEVPSTVPLCKIPVDLFLVVFVNLWVHHDLTLTNVLKRGFQDSLSLVAIPQAAANAPDGGASNAVYTFTRTVQQVQHTKLDKVMQVLQSLEDSLPVLDLDDLRKTFQSILDSKRSVLKRKFSSPKLNKRPNHLTTPSASSASSSATGSTGRTGPSGGINEREFVFHVMQHLRSFRGARGIRTNGCALFCATAKASLGAFGHLLSSEQETDLDHTITLDHVKPGVHVTTQQDA